MPLYNAVVEGDWVSTKRFIMDHPETLSAPISFLGETALHVAAVYGHVQLVEELLNLMPAEALAIVDIKGDTALNNAAIGGITKIAEGMVKKNDNLVCIRDKRNLIPVAVAALSGNKDMVRFLYRITPVKELSPEISDSGASLLTAAISADMFDVALDLLQQFPRLAIALDSRRETALNALAKKPSAFLSGSPLNFWQRLIYSAIIYVQPHDIPNVEADVENPRGSFQDQASLMWQFRLNMTVLYRPRGKLRNMTMLYRSRGKFWNIMQKLVPGIKKIYDLKWNHMQALQLLKCITCDVHVSHFDEFGVYSAIFLAAELGTFEFITEMTKSFPMMMLAQDKFQHNILLIAIKHRQRRIFDHIRGVGAIRRASAYVTDSSGNNALHLAAMLPPPSRLERVSGAAMQMQQELQWFKEVEKIVEPAFREATNSYGKTPRTLFTEHHKELVKEGEKWMKDSSTSCMVVAALIASVMFAAALTVPGGYTNDTGIPIFKRRHAFMIFLVSDALSLFSSSASLMIFLYNFMSRYAEEDFLKTLPQRMMLGLVMLIFSIITMTVAFCATLDILLESPDRMNVERQCLAREFVNIVASEGEERIERYEVAGKWRARMTMAGFTSCP
ncbi:hypothetical protein HHK36_030476 [Tetracentron sinense]|uniref:PGG domain-containing protein n=1 Tax=Tetracentron sinense TaxID=13715 RepID=A0A834Y9F9_TETSI|nr:hypothetical protein HHK36_030476 [Tetracentron sinense]